MSLMRYIVNTIQYNFFCKRCPKLAQKAVVGDWAGFGWLGRFGWVGPVLAHGPVLGYGPVLDFYIYFLKIQILFNNYCSTHSFSSPSLFFLFLFSPTSFLKKIKKNKTLVGFEPMSVRWTLYCMKIQCYRSFLFSFQGISIYTSYI